ncbi:MAG: helix-turn-helix domain-containing protein, partial [Spirochaetaceae bacterium]|nr:helix-turn-helix domain-containing protein [Spirochaetaceae bacterium]
ITDIRMPGEDGLTLLARLRDSGWKGLCAIVSGYDDFAYAQRAIRLGVFDFLLKPVFPEDMRRLLGKVREQLGPGMGSDCAAMALPGSPSSEAPPAAAPGAKYPLPEPVRRVVDFVEAHYDSRFSLDAAARVAGVSPAWISSSFKRIFGCSVMEYARVQRVHKAKELLSGTELPLKDIADRLAFPDVPTFSKLFRKVAGESPGAYRKSRRNGAWRRGRERGDPASLSDRGAW